MIYVIVKNGVVVNRTQASEPLASNWIQSDTAQIGWLYNPSTGEFSPPPFPSPEVPQSLSPVQARLVMNRRGLREQVEALIQQSGNQDIKDYWEYSMSIERNHPILLDLAAQLEITSEELDEMFIEGAIL